ncbi:MAG: ATP-dependent DNA helicase [Proteobacteria bacterium]|nr:ATP-dependent DNA helicase [Pseudomonadota bacterium]
MRLSHPAAHSPARPTRSRRAVSRPRWRALSPVEDGGALVVEAGTGVGKTFAYLVPALLSGERVLLSTATKTLQDQLFGRDLPRLIRSLGLPLRCALLKGRGSYLCLHRLDSARHDPALRQRAAQRDLAKIELWAQVTRSGDLAELPELDERSPLIPLVTSTRDNCLGAQCPKYRSCHVNLARREALAADVVVINHHLFFADLAVRESGMAELLPSVRIAVFDEAHQLNETGVQFLGVRLGTGQLLDFAHDLLAAGLQFARGLVDWQAVAAALEQATRELRLCAGGRSAGGSRLAWNEAAPEGLSAPVWTAALAALRQALARALEALDPVVESAPDFARLAERAAQLAERAEHFAEACEPPAVRWVEAGAQLRLIESPLDIADTMRDRVLRQGLEQPDAEPPRRSWIFTSATLGDEARLRWFTEPCGLADAEVLRLGSPFDYEARAAVYVPQQLARPGDPDHSLQVAALVEAAARQLGGRTLVLTTTLRALRSIGDALQQRLGFEGGIEVLMQGQGPKRQLMERFRQGSGAGRGCVLVASASFWEGVDVPGDALQLVVIDKLPFPPPGDPLVQARARRLELDGRSPFNDYFVPEAAVALKQGAGRLIRSESDRGVLVICDPRLASMGYGRRLLAALPPMRRLRSEAEFLQALIDLNAARADVTRAARAAPATRASTTDWTWA